MPENIGTDMSEHADWTPPGDRKKRVEAAVESGDYYAVGDVVGEMTNREFADFIASWEPDVEVEEPQEVEVPGEPEYHGEGIA